MPDLSPAQRRFWDEFPGVSEAHFAMGAFAQESGPLDKKTRELVKVALAVGGSDRAAVQANTCLALEAGASPAEIKHIIVLAAPTLGLTKAIDALTWVNPILDE